MGCSSSTHTEKIYKLFNNQKDMFVVQGLIGEGGFGKVLAATLLQTGKWYAVKEINKYDLMKHKSGLSMITGELNALKRVEEHAFIVSLHLAYSDRRNCYFVLDLVTGGDLRYYLRRKVVFEEKDVAFYVACISSALEHIHSRNMIHRDIKPENIILDERGYPHLADFGVAHVQDIQTSEDSDSPKPLTSNLASGTKQYLAPEVFCKTHTHGPESDYWSLAVVAYELLYGKRPFEKHCSIQFIQYLEKALSLKRKQLKHKVKEEGHRAPPSALPAVPLSPSRPGSRPGSSHSQSGSGAGTEHLFFPNLGSSDSGDLNRGDRGSFDSPAQSQGNFCSSVNYTGAHTQQTLSNTDALLKFNNSRCSSRGSSRQGTDVENTVEAGEGSGRQWGAGAAAGGIAGDKGIGYDEEGVTIPKSVSLPQMSGTSIPGSPPRMVKNKPGIPLSCSTPKLSAKGEDDSLPALSPPRPNQHGSSRSTVCGGSPLISPRTSQSQSQSPSPSSSLETEDLMGFLRFHPIRAPPGDHWAVDEDTFLPHDLRVHVPPSNAWLGKISAECVGFLRGMFDIRPSHRLGVRDVNALRTHSWMKVNGVADWEHLQKGGYEPRFKPGKRFMRDTFEDVANMLVMGQTLGPRTPSVEDACLYDEDELLLSSEQNAAFASFLHVGESFRSYMPREAPPPSPRDPPREQKSKKRSTGVH